MATEAYSVIEQGKVDVLLQASPRDRRLIFEEAAGISRFKAKKIEALRRLERVEQNLLRLCDIVEEVDNRLRSVRAQATKARKYKEYADRLQELRTQVGLADWRKLSGHLDGLETELTQMRDQAAAAAAQTERLEAQVLGLELEIVGAEESIRSNDARIGQNRERIAAYEATSDHERRLSAELQQEVSRYRRQLTAMSLRAGNLEAINCGPRSRPWPQPPRNIANTPAGWETASERSRIWPASSISCTPATSRIGLNNCNSCGRPRPWAIRSAHWNRD